MLGDKKLKYIHDFIMNHLLYCQQELQCTELMSDDMQMILNSISLLILMIWDSGNTETDIYQELSSPGYSEEPVAGPEAVSV